MADPSFHAPATVPEALGLLRSPDAVALAGGTATVFLLKQGLIVPERLVWLGRIEELRGIREDPDGRLHIGAGTTLHDLSRSASVLRRHPALAAAASHVGNIRVRAVATVGGALVHADPRQDLLPALLACGATARVQGRGGARDVALDDGFFQGFLQTVVEPGELVTEVTLPGGGATRQRYRRFTPGSASDYPTVAVAAAVEVAPSGVIRDVRLALGGVADTPVLVRDVRDVLRDRPPDPARIAQAAEAAAAATAPADDAQGSPAYKTAMARVETQRVLTELLEAPEHGDTPSAPVGPPDRGRTEEACR